MRRKFAFWHTNQPIQSLQLLTGQAARLRRGNLSCAAKDHKGMRTYGITESVNRLRGNKGVEVQPTQLLMSQPIQPLFCD